MPDLPNIIAGALLAVGIYFLAQSFLGTKDTPKTVHLTEEQFEQLRADIIQRLNLRP